MKVFHFYATLLVFCGANKTPNRPIVNVKEGFLQGTTRISAEGIEYYAFEGIRYAEPPKRFKPSVPVKPWTGVWTADAPGSDCLQYTQLSSEDKINGEEDCLFLNVYTSKLPSDGDESLLDVVVYIHGGAFMFGGGQYYGPKYLVDRNIVFVTINYRLGILGFLSTGDTLVPGNNGLKDQVLALKWIQGNIAVFSGNPKSVTLIGTSAGGASVQYHYLSPLSKGLFQRGISFSGTALCPWAFAEKMEQKTRRLAAIVGCSSDSTKELVRCLRSRPARQIVAQTVHFQPWLYNPFSPFGPTTEKPSDSAFITQNPLHILVSGRAQDLPWITTVTSEDGLYPVADYLSNDKFIVDLDKQFFELAPHILDYNYTVVPRRKIKEVGESIRRFYFGNDPIDSISIPKLIKLSGDRHFNIPAESAARIQAENYKSPVYFYYFSYRGLHSFSEVLAKNNVNYGTCHGDDMAYVINVNYCITNETEADRNMTQLMLDILTNYIRTGIPEIPSKFNISWPPVTQSSKLEYLHIVSPNQLKVESTKNLGNREFWNTLPIEEPRYMPRKISDEL